MLEKSKQTRGGNRKIPKDLFITVSITHYFGQLFHCSLGNSLVLSPLVLTKEILEF